MKQNIRSLLLAGLLGLTMLTGCAKPQESSAGGTLPPAAEPATEAAQPAADGYDILGGTWTVGGFLYEGQIIDISDNEGLADLYDSSFLMFHEDGTFLYMNIYNARGQYIRQDSNVFMLKTETESRFEFEDDQLVEVESEADEDSSYIITLLDKGTFTLSFLDPATGKAEEDDLPLIFERYGQQSEYIARNKTPLKDSGDSSSTQKTYSRSEIDAMLQGTYTYDDDSIGYHEVVIFEDGELLYTSYLDAAPEKATSSPATYQIYDGYVSMYFPKTGYTNEMDYEVRDGELVLLWYIDSGADKGNTRVYTRQGDGTIPGGYSAAAPKDTTRKDTAKKPSQSSKVTSGMRNALQSALNYLDVLPFSYTGLIEQLEYEGYTYSEAVYAVDNCGADWYEQAVWSARNYLDVMSFSRSGLIEQLEYEGFTHDQAVYGVNEAY